MESSTRQQGVGVNQLAGTGLHIGAPLLSIATVLRGGQP